MRCSKPSLRTPQRNGSSMTDNDRLREIQERVEKATEGPWHAACWPHDTVEQLVDETAVALRKSDSTDLFGVWVDREQPLFTAVTGNGPTSRENAAFIAHAREDIPYLLDQLQQATQEIARLREYTQHKRECPALLCVHPEEHPLVPGVAPCGASAGPWHDHEFKPGTCTCGLSPEGREVIP